MGMLCYRFSAKMRFSAKYAIASVPSFPFVTSYEGTLPPLPIRIRSGAVEEAVLSAGYDVHPGGGGGVFMPLGRGVVRDGTRLGESRGGGKDGGS